MPGSGQKGASGGCARYNRGTGYPSAAQDFPGGGAGGGERDVKAEKIRYEAKHTTGRPNAVALPSRETIRKICHKIAHVKVAHPTLQNERRWLLVLDLRNSLCMAAGIVFDPANLRNVPDLMTNTDATKILLGEHESDAVFVTPGLAEKLAEEHKSVGLTKHQSSMKAHTISMIATTTAADRLLCSICLIEDTSVESFQCIKVQVIINVCVRAHVCVRERESVRVCI